MHNFEIIVQFGTNTVELGYCDADYISIITLLHCMSKKTIGKEDVPKEQFCVFVILPWCNDVVEVKNDNELVNVFSMFREHGCSRIVFEIDYQPYVPLPPEGSSCTPNAVDPEVLIDEYEGLDVDDLDENYFTYHGDDEDGGSVNGEEGALWLRFLKVHGKKHSYFGSLLHVSVVGGRSVGFHVVMQWLLLAIILVEMETSNSNTAPVTSDAALIPMEMILIFLYLHVDEHLILKYLNTPKKKFGPKKLKIDF
ncbi:hypothetical protein ACOSQ4_027035 [Xanthoceras sorbifolium]